MAELDNRGERSPVVRDSLDRYFTMLTHARASLREALTPDEVALIVDAANGTLYEAWSIPHLVHGIEDAIALDGLDKKWGVDGHALVMKLKGLGLAETFALVDAAERFWHATSQGINIELAQTLK